eukprot:SAG22_NODE_82_length_21749_cov_10.719769_4_plen_85_part_00
MQLVAFFSACIWEHPARGAGGRGSTPSHAARWHIYSCSQQGEHGLPGPDLSGVERGDGDIHIEEHACNALGRAPAIELYACKSI